MNDARMCLQAIRHDTLKAEKSKCLDCIIFIPLRGKKEKKHLVSSLQPHLKLIHDLADALAPGSNNAGMNPAVEGDVLRDHLFKLIHDGLDGITCCYGFVLIPCNSNLILWRPNNQNLSSHILIFRDCSETILP